jgi:hypothetical protein
MQKPDWTSSELQDGLLREPSPDPSRLIVWINPGKKRCFKKQTERGADGQKQGI